MYYLFMILSFLVQFLRRHKNQFPEKMTNSTWSNISRHLYVRMFKKKHFKLSLFTVQTYVSYFWNHSRKSFCYFLNFIWNKKTHEKMYVELFFILPLNETKFWIFETTMGITYLHFQKRLSLSISCWSLSS